MAKVNALRQLQSQTQEGLDALLPSVLRPAGGRLRESCDPLPVLPPNQSADLGEGEWKVGMKRKIEKSLDERRCIVVYLYNVQTRLTSLREPSKGVILQSQTQEELGALLPSVFDKAFKGKL